MNNKYRSQSRYCYPGTDVLINKFDEKDLDKLTNLETTFTTRRIYQLYEKPIAGSFGLKHLQKIHRFIFKDVYSFAGEFRDEQISKGTTTFAHPLHIHSFGNDILKELKNEQFLKGLNKENFAERASYYLGEVNILHPFREGNGRVQRELFRILALKNGYELDWSKISPDEMLKSSIQSVNDSAAFKIIFMKAIINSEPDQTLIKEFRSLKKSNELEL
ncbi:Fic family protein [Robertmurraya korlensis]|uniref:Fic/DOC family protein n=1 Tax=Robertmurraya korlensis TaxID=519977 RepID=UPI00203E67BA|nr:Fic family protein [Robertmurraya korlensis]MCM3603144.1 Fic family protein [Robertmurraya korlensis]